MEDIMQICNKCDRKLPFTDFHKHPGFASGIRKTCKKCACAASKKWYEENREYHLEVCKEWQRKNRKKVINYRREKYERTKLLRKEYGKVNPERIEARKKLNSLMRKGEIKKPSQCQVCGNHSEEVEGHHYDYSKPGDVIWVCKSCHGWIHRKYRINEVQSEFKTA